MVAMQLFCQWIALLLVVAQFIASVHSDFRGRTAKEPGDFSGFLVTCVVIAVVALVHYGAGAFTLILK